MNVASGLGKLDFSSIADTAVGREVVKEGIGSYEPEALAAVFAMIETEQPATFLDIGANVGVFALCSRVLFPKVKSIAFEPLPKLVTHAKHLAAINKAAFEIRQQAVGATAGTATLYVSAKSDSSNSLRQGFRTAKEELQVPVTTIDEVLAGERGPIVMKIDTESTEPDVLRGAQKTLATLRPWIICEVLAGRVEPELMELLRPHGYRFYHLTTQMDWTPSAEIYGDRTYKFRDWLFAPSEPSEAMKANFVKWLDELERLPIPAPVKRVTRTSGPMSLMQRISGRARRIMRLLD